MKWFAIAVVGIVVLLVGYAVYMSQWTNPRVIQALHDDPQGKQAEKVMLLTLPSGRSIPVNYLRDESTVYAAADGSWWRELRDAGGRGSVLIQGETLQGEIRAELDDANLRDSVFERLRPTAPRFFGRLIVIELD
ncbi:MAG: hypothetical protein GY937_26285 [bacterium]|nr:hypothetical protein [bacterium]